MRERIAAKFGVEVTMSKLTELPVVSFIDWLDVIGLHEASVCRVNRARR